MSISISHEKVYDKIVRGHIIFGNMSPSQNCQPCQNWRISPGAPYLGESSPPKDDNDLLSDKPHVVTHDVDRKFYAATGSARGRSYRTPRRDLFQQTRELPLSGRNRARHKIVFFLFNSFSARLWGRNLSANRDKPWRCWKNISQRYWGTCNSTVLLFGAYLRVQIRVDPRQHPQDDKKDVTSRSLQHFFFLLAGVGNLAEKLLIELEQKEWLYRVHDKVSDSEKVLGNLHQSLWRTF